MREGGSQGRGEAEQPEHEPRPGCGGEAAGQAAADCAAVCCCCPMALLELALLVAFRLPADLVRRARLSRRRRLRRSGRGNASLTGSAKAMIAAEAAAEADEAAAGARRVEAEDEAACELEREIMGSRFYGAGFWRTASSRSSSCASSARRL